VTQVIRSETSQIKKSWNPIPNKANVEG